MTIRRKTNARRLAWFIIGLAITVTLISFSMADAGNVKGGGLSAYNISDTNWRE